MTAADVKAQEAVAKAAAEFVIADREDDAVMREAQAMLSKSEAKRKRKYRALREAVKAANPRAEGEYEGTYESRINRACGEAMGAAESVMGGAK